MDDISVRSLDFKPRDFSSTDTGGILAPGEWWTADSLIGDFEIHRFKDRNGWFLFWKNNRRGEVLETLAGAISRANVLYSGVILSEIQGYKDSLQW